MGGGLRRQRRSSRTRGREAASEHFEESGVRAGRRQPDANAGGAFDDAGGDLGYRALLREMISFAAHRLMELDVAGLTGAGHGERNPDRMTQRDGYRAGYGRPGLGRSSFAFRGCVKGVTFPACWSPGAWRRRR